MAENGIRTPNVPSASLIEVLGHYDAGGGQRALGRTSIQALVDALRGVISTDPTGVATLRAALTQAENSRISADDSLQRQIYDRALASSVLDVAKRVDTKAEQADLLNVARRTDAKVDQTALDATNASAAALAATVEGNNVDAPVLGRPGDDPRSYTYADTFAQIVGPARSLPRVPARLVAVGDNGSVLRLDQPAIIATRRRFAVEPDRLYRPRAVLRRRVNVADPSNDAVQVSVVWLDQAGGLIGTQVVASLLELSSSDGRTSVQSTFALAAGTGVQLPPAPAGTRYARLAVQSFAYTGRLDLEVLDLADVTDATLLPPISSDFVARLEQQESVNAGDRLDVVEATVATPSVQTFKAVSDAAAATIKPSVATIRTLGQGTSGDGGGSTYVRALAEEPADFTSQGGTRWRQTLDGLTGALPCSWTGLRKFVPPAIMMVASLIGSATAGDLGFGTPIQRITASQAATSPNRPQQDALGAWWEIATAQGVSVGWFGAKYDAGTSDTAAIQAALSCSATQVNGHPGISNAGNLIRPASKIWNGRGGYLRPTASCSAIMTAKDGGSVLDTHFAGNLVADQGLVTDGPRIVVSGNYVEYCNKGYANTANGVAITFNSNGSAHCTYGRYSGGGSNNSVWIGERSDNDTYGAFYTYEGNPDTAQPQAVRWFGHCMLGNQFGIWFDKNHYVFESYGGVIDVCYQTALRTAANGAVVTVMGGFLSARGVAVDIGEGTNGITFDTVGIANGVVNLLIRATATAKCQGVSIKRCDIGTASSAAIILDSPDRSWVVEQSTFAPYYPSGVPQIATRRSYTANIGSLAPAKIRDNTFKVRDGAVSTDLTECKGNIGWVTKQTVAVNMPANATSVAWPLAMSVVPTFVTNVRAQADVGFVYADTFSTSGMLVKCTKAPTVDTVILMTVEADLYLGAA